MADALWDTSWLLNDRDLVGSFLAGLVGYRAQLSAFEVGAYAAYLVGASLLLFGRAGSRSLPPVRPGGAPARVG